MASERDFWVETVDKTYLYYKVKAKSTREALDKFLSGDGEYVGCNDECNEAVRDILRDEPHTSWS